MRSSDGSSDASTTDSTESTEFSGDSHSSTLLPMLVNVNTLLLWHKVLMDFYLFDKDSSASARINTSKKCRFSLSPPGNFWYAARRLKSSILALDYREKLNRSPSNIPIRLWRPGETAEGKQAQTDSCMPEFALLTSPRSYNWLVYATLTRAIRVQFPGGEVPQAPEAFCFYSQLLLFQVFRLHRRNAPVA